MHCSTINFCPVEHGYDAYELINNVCPGCARLASRKVNLLFQPMGIDLWTRKLPTDVLMYCQLDI